jgi:hypothetical protein
MKLFTCLGSATDRSGKQGITIELLNNFIENCEKYAAWYAKKEADIKTIFHMVIKQKKRIKILLH